MSAEAFEPRSVSDDVVAARPIELETGVIRIHPDEPDAELYAFRAPGPLRDEPAQEVVTAAPPSIDRATALRAAVFGFALHEDGSIKQPGGFYNLPGWAKNRQKENQGEQNG